MMLAALFGFVLFGAAGFAGSVAGRYFAERLESLPGGPSPARAPVPLLLACCALIGAAIGPRTTPVHALVLALVCAALIAVWITDARRGIVPDIFTLGPLALVLFIALREHAWWLMISAAVPFVPFAAAALITNGRGMGWGDVKLAALGGALLGAEISLLAFSIACAAAAAINFFQGRRRGAIAFAPYLAAAIGLALPLGAR